MGLEEELKQFEELSKEFKEKDMMDSEDYFIAGLALSFTISDETFQLLIKNYKKESAKLSSQKRREKMSCIEYDTKVRNKIAIYAPFLGVMPEDRKEIFSVYNQLKNSKEEDFLKNVIESRWEKQIEPFYQAYMCYLHLDKGMKGIDAREYALKNIVNELKKDSSKTELWLNGLPEAPKQILIDYVI